MQSAPVQVLCFDTYMYGPDSWEVHTHPFTQETYYFDRRFRILTTDDVRVADRRHRARNWQKTAQSLLPSRQGQPHIDYSDGWRVVVRDGRLIAIYCPKRQERWDFINWNIDPRVVVKASDVDFWSLWADFPCHDQVPEGAWERLMANVTHHWLMISDYPDSDRIWGYCCQLSHMGEDLKGVPLEQHQQMMKVYGHHLAVLMARFHRAFELKAIQAR